MPLACFASIALSSLSAFAAGPSSTALSTSLDSLPMSLRDSLSLPMAGPAVADDSFASSTAADAAPLGASALSSLDSGATSLDTHATAPASGSDTFAAIGGQADPSGASPMLASPGEGAQPLGGGVADALAGMNGYGATGMVGDGMGGRPMLQSFRGSSMSGGFHGGVMSMSAWSTSW